MYEVTVEDSFAAGHYLRNYRGKCENPHGHNYKVRVTLAGEQLDKAGLLIDFKDLREVMKHVIDRLDHRMINDLEPFTVLNPSAENLAKYFFDEANSRLRSSTNGRVGVKMVTIFETDTTTATYSEISRIYRMRGAMLNVMEMSSNTGVSSRYCRAASTVPPPKNGSIG